MGEKYKKPIILVTSSLFGPCTMLGQIIAETYQMPYFSFENILWSLLPAFTKNGTVTYPQAKQLLERDDLRDVINKIRLFFKESSAGANGLVVSGFFVSKLIEKGNNNVILISLNDKEANKIHLTSFTLDERTLLEMLLKDVLQSFPEVTADKKISLDTLDNAILDFENLQKNEIFRSISETILAEDQAVSQRYKCMRCGLIIEGIKGLSSCARCGNNNGDLFEDL